MSCENCDSSNISLTGSWFPGSPCENNDCGGATTNSLCVIYNGPNLPCSGVETSDSIEIALQKIDEQICAISGDYSTYNMNCLPTWWGASITNQADFVDAITGFACEIRDDLATFIGVVYPCNQEILDNRLIALEIPGITCSFASVISTDTLQEVLTKYCAAFSDLETSLDLSGVTWNNCLVISGNPSTISEGFQLISDQICSLYTLVAEGGILPTFNNSLSCIGGGSTDSVETTINLIKDRLCLTPTIDMDNIIWGCFTEGATFEEMIIKMVAQLGTLTSNQVEFDAGDFVLTPIDAMDPCAGNTVSLAVPLNLDRFVASNASDTSPSTLVDKLSTTGSISLDDSDNTTISIDVADGDKGDITVSSTGSIWTIDSTSVTLAKIQNVSTTTLLGRATAGSGSLEQLSIGSNLSFSGTTLNTVGRTLIGITAFTSSGTWFKPTGCNAVVVYTLGAGGGGGGAIVSSASEVSLGSGGGAGAFAVDFITSGLGSTETVSIGIGGAGGIVGTAYEGVQGGTTSFGAHTSCEGGYGGKTMGSGTSTLIATGAAGGFSITGGNVYRIYGDPGKYAIRLGYSAAGDTQAFSPGNGGVPAIGGTNTQAGAGGTGTASINGGAAGPQAGGSGLVIVMEYS